MPSEVLASMWMTAGGVIPAGWSLVAFEELLLHPKSMSVGVMYPGDDVSDGVPLIRVGDVKEGVVSGKPSMSVAHSVHEEYRRTELTGNELLITLVGDPGQCVVAEPYMKGWNVARALAVARLKDETLRGFLKALFRAPPMRTIIRSMLNTTVQPTLNLKEIKSLPILVPPVEVRKEISATLSSFDDKIVLLREINATLEAIAQALFKSWFVDFDPVRAKAEGRDPIGMPPEVADLFPSEFEDSELGEIPKGWRVGRLGDVLKQRVERTKPSSQTEQLPYVPIECISSKSVFLVESRPGIEAQSSLTLFRKGDIVFGAMRPYFHKVCLAPFDGVTRTTAFVLAPIRPEMAMFALFQMFDDRTIEFATNHSEGSTIPYAKWAGSMENMSIVVPPDDVAAAFGEIVDGLMRRGIQNTEQSQSLAELRDTLLPRLMSGKLRIPEIQEAIAEATA